MDLSAEYWTKRYVEGDFPWDAGGVTTPLKEYIDQLNDKNISILIPGAGNAHEAEYLVDKGFPNVTVLDLSDAPLKQLKKRCPSINDENLIQQDFFLHEKKYDLIIEQTFFCAIDVNLRAAYAKQAHSLLKPGGKLVGILFDCVFEKQGPPFGGSKDEYLNYFDPYFECKIMEKCYNSIKPREGRELFINLLRK